MEQLIFVGVILLFTILDAVARKQKKQAQERGGGPVLLPEEWDEAEDASGAGSPIEGSTRLPGPAAGRTTAKTPSSSSEGLIPSDVWDEIQRMARGGRPEPARPSLPEAIPEERAPLPRRAPLRTQPASRAGVPAPTRTHAVHLLHPDMGKPVAQRLSPLDLPRTAGRAPSPEVATVRSLLSGGGEDLRTAVILQEVLGPPAAVRGDPYEPGG